MRRDVGVYFHVWFKTKERKWLLLGDVEERALKEIRMAAQRHHINLLAGETMVDHVHLLLEVENDSALSRAMHLLKGASSRAVFQAFPDLKLDAGISHFWQKRYGAKLISPAAVSRVANYIRTQKERPEKYAR